MNALDKAATEIYKILSVKDIEIYNADGNRVYESADARNFFIKDTKTMVSIVEDGAQNNLNIRLSGDTNLSEFEMNLGQRLRNITAKYGMSYNIRSYGKEIELKDVAQEVHVIGESDMTQDISEGMYGTTKTSYQKVGECKVIIRHSAKVNEDKFGSRSRNIHAIFVETKGGERFKVSENNIHGARAMARHLSNGGSPFDTVGMKVSTMMSEMDEIKGVIKDARSITKNAAINEELDSLQEQMRTRFLGIRESLKRMGGIRGYTTMAASLTEAEIVEYKETDDYKSLTNPWKDQYKWQQAVETFVNRKMEQNKLRKPNAQLSQADALALLDFSHDTMKLYRDLIAQRYASPAESIEEDKPTHGSKIDALAWEMGNALSHPEKYGPAIAQRMKNVAVPELPLSPMSPSFQHNHREEPETIETYQTEFDMLQKMDDAARSEWIANRKQEIKAANAHNNQVDSAFNEWSTIISKLQMLSHSDKTPLTPTDVQGIKAAAAELNFDLNESILEAEMKDIFGDGSVDVDDVKVEKDAERQVQDMANFGRDEEVNPDDLMAGEPVMKEEAMLESWFNESSEVEFFEDDELEIEEALEVGAPETVLEFDETPELASAYGMFSELMGNRKMSSDEALEKAARHYADTVYGGDEQSYERAYEILKQMGVEGGLIFHDDGRTFADDVMSPGEEVRGHKDEIEAEQFYGDSRFEEEVIEAEEFGLDRLTQLAGVEPTTEDDDCAAEDPSDEFDKELDNDGAVPMTNQPKKFDEEIVANDMPYDEAVTLAKDMAAASTDESIEEKRDEDENADDWEDDDNWDDKEDKKAKNQDKRNRRKKRADDRFDHMDEAAGDEDEFTIADELENADADDTEDTLESRIIELSRYRPSR